jgi:hypothetical protein
MTHKTKILSTFLLLASAAPAMADPVMVLEKPDQSGPPGGFAGWTFTLKADPTAWISLIGSFVLEETNASIGGYVDFSGFQGGPTNGVLALGAADWTSVFDPTFVGSGGLGVYFIDSLQIPGAGTHGTIRVLYERFNANPLTCGGGCRTGDGQLDVPFSVTVGAPPSAVPEPEPSVLLILGGVLLAGARGLRRFPVGQGIDR